MHKNVIKVSIISTSAVVMMMSMIAGLTFNKWAGIPVYSYPKAYLGVLFASSVFLSIMNHRKVTVKWHDILHKENFQTTSVFILFLFSTLFGVSTGITLKLISVLT